VLNDETNQADEKCSTIGDGPIGTTTDKAGYTDAPDLETCDVDVEGEQIDLGFDEDLDTDQIDPQGENFYIFDAGSDETSGDTGDVDDVDGTHVTVDFEGEDLSDVEGCGVEEDSVADESDNENVEATVGSEAPSSAPPSSTATSTTTVTTTSSPSHTPETVRVASTITIRYDAKPKKKAAFKGSVAARFEKCTTGRLVELHKKGGGVVGRDTTNKKGNWKVGERNANGTYFAEVLKKVFTRGNGDTVICRKDSSVKINV
jgi:hypothetical protein